MKKILSIIMMMMCTLYLCAQNNPNANPDAVITSGKARFTVLTPEMIRIQYSGTSTFEDRATFGVVNRELPVPAFTTTEEDGYLYITTEALELKYKIGSRINPSLKSPNNLQITVKALNEIWYPGKEDALNLKGTFRTLDNISGDTGRNRLETGVVSRSGWSIIDESPTAVHGDGSKVYAFQPMEDDFDWVDVLADTNSSTIDWYFMGYGHDYKKAMGDFTKVAGKIPLPPKHMFGYWYSRYWAYTANEFMQIVRDVEKNDIPMDIMIMDMDWHKSGWTGWSWNKNLIPNPKTLINYMHNHGLKVALNLHPADGIGTYEDHYQDMRNTLGDDAQLAPDNAILWTIEDHTFSKAFFKDIIRPLESDGVDFWWLDWQQQKTVGGHAHERGYTCPAGLEGLGETFWCNHVFFNDMVKNRADKRPVIYHRWGGMGSHRYQIGFSGDTYSNWATLQWQPYFTSTASNVGYGYWGHDLGGHQYDPDCNNPERYLRWMQFGIFTPIFRTHATNDGRIERRIWKFSNFPQLRETIVLRYALFPYIYTAARQAYDTGVGINRPLYYDYPEVNNAYRYEDEYMFGDNILVAPVTTAAEGDAYEEKISERTTWLPEGLWWDVAKNRLINGNVTFTEKYTLDEIPYFFKGGSVIVNYPYQRTVQTTPTTIILKVTPGGEGTGSFYEDAGDNQDYAENYAITHYTNSSNENGATLTIGGREGTFEGMPEERTYQVEFLGANGAPTSVTVNGEGIAEDSYAYDEENGIITVMVAMENCAEGKTVAVVAPFQSATTLDDHYQQSTTTTGGDAKLWIMGEAVPNGLQPLESYADGTCRYHGTLTPGQFYIINTEGEKSTTNYYAPARKYCNIVCEDANYSAKTNSNDAAWNVTTGADNYRIVVNTSKRTVNGELFVWLLEMYIGGGCVADEQADGWHTNLFKLMENDETDKNVWEYVGELKRYNNNVEANRFKLMGQKDWGPISFHPFSSDEPVLNTSIMRQGGDDTKWTIDKDGFYRIRVDAFRQTITAEYLGTELPDGIETTETRLQKKGDTYNIIGMKVSENFKGIKIRDGKKFISY